MNLVNITDNDLKIMYKYLLGEEVENDLIEELKGKLEYCVSQIDVRNEYMDKVEELNKKYEEAHKEEKGDISTGEGGIDISDVKEEVTPKVEEKKEESTEEEEKAPEEKKEDIE